MARLAGLGVVRCLKIEAGEGDAYLVLLRLTLHNGQRVYRYGRVPDLPAATRLLDHWLKRQAWSPDKLDDQWRPALRRS